MPKYPDITVELLGRPGNAFFILGKVGRAMKEADIPEDEIAKFREDATSGDYDNLLTTCMKYVNIT